MRNCDESPKYRRVGAYLPLIAIIVVTSACGLVSYGIPPSVVIDAADNWYELKAPYISPMNPSEDAAVQASKSCNVVKINDITAICLAANDIDQLVVTVSGTSRLSDHLSPKKITYYRITGGKISAYSKTVLEPSLDVDYEQTIFNVALKSKATSNKAVTIYSRADQNLTVVGNAGNCMAEVSVILDFEPYREPFSVRFVPICSQ